ncbi:hypothetical protein T06_15021 [Trichinella sp. T6]|nr:hypothetical protein T06_15021 [Trichinella sp. T6]
MSCAVCQALQETKYNGSNTSGKNSQLSSRVQKVILGQGLRIFWSEVCWMTSRMETISYETAKVPVDFDSRAHL